MYLKEITLTKKESSFRKFLTNRVVLAVVNPKLNVLATVLIQLMVRSVLLLGRNKEYRVLGVIKQFKSFRSTIKIYRDQILYQIMSTDRPILLITDILNILVKAHILTN